MTIMKGGIDYDDFRYLKSYTWGARYVTPFYAPKMQIIPSIFYREEWSELVAAWTYRNASIITEGTEKILKLSPGGVVSTKIAHPFGTLLWRGKWANAPGSGVEEWMGFGHIDDANYLAFIIDGSTFKAEAKLMGNTTSKTLTFPTDGEKKFYTYKIYWYRDLAVFLVGTTRYALLLSNIPERPAQIHFGNRSPSGDMHLAWSQYGTNGAYLELPVTGLPLYKFGEADGATTDLYTVPSNQVFFITATQLNYIHKAAGTHIAALQIYDGTTANNILRLAGPDSVDHSTISKPYPKPLKVPEGYSIRVWANANTKGYACVEGYLF